MLSSCGVPESRLGTDNAISESSSVPFSSAGLRKKHPHHSTPTLGSRPHCHNASSQRSGPERPTRSDVWSTRSDRVDPSPAAAYAFGMLPRSRPHLCLAFLVAVALVSTARADVTLTRTVAVDPDRLPAVGPLELPVGERIGRLE